MEAIGVILKADRRMKTIIALLLALGCTSCTSSSQAEGTIISKSLDVPGHLLARVSPSLYFLAGDSGRVTLYDHSNGESSQFKFMSWGFSEMTPLPDPSGGKILIGGPGVVIIIGTRGVDNASIEYIEFDKERSYFPKAICGRASRLWWATTTKDIYESIDGVAQKRKAISTQATTILLSASKPDSSMSLLAVSRDVHRVEQVLLYDFEKQRIADSATIDADSKVHRVDESSLLVQSATGEVKMLTESDGAIVQTPLKFKLPEGSHSFLLLKNGGLLVSGSMSLMLFDPDGEVLAEGIGEFSQAIQHSETHVLAVSHGKLREITIAPGVK